MSTLYLTNITGDGLSAVTSFRPLGFDGKSMSALMIDTTKGRALILSNDDTVTGTGITPLLMLTSVAALRTYAATNNPSATNRTAISGWLTTNGYMALTASQVTWLDCFSFIGRQVNTASNLGLTSV